MFKINNLIFNASTRKCLLYSYIVFIIFPKCSKMLSLTYKNQFKNIN